MTSDKRSGCRGWKQRERGGESIRLGFVLEAEAHLASIGVFRLSDARRLEVGCVRIDCGYWLEASRGWIVVVGLGWRVALDYRVTGDAALKGLRSAVGG